MKRNKLKYNRTWIFIFLLPTCLLFLLVYAIPLVLVFTNSLFEYRMFPSRFEFIGLGNFQHMITDDATFKQAFINTVLWMLIHCTIHIVLGCLLAFILYKKPVGWKFVRVAYMIPNIVSQAAIAMIFLNIYNPQFGLLNSLLSSLGLANLQHNWLFDQATAYPSVTMTWLIFAGYTTTLVLAQALSVDKEIIEAAQVDGASWPQIDWLIMRPMVSKMIGTTVVMAAAYMLQLFSLIYITTGGGPGTTTMNLPLLLYQAMKAGNYGYANAVGVFIVVLGFISMTIINKMFGLNRGD